MKSSNMALLIVDWQERLVPAMPASLYETALSKAKTLQWFFNEMGLSVFVTEQYPKGLGPTVLSLQPIDAMEKTTFSVMSNKGIFKQLMDSNADHYVVIGMETHICVYQSVLDLMNEGKSVTLITDACLSRRKIDWKTAIGRMQLKGAEIMTAEMFLFDFIKDAKSPLFKELSRRIK